MSKLNLPAVAVALSVLAPGAAVAEGTQGGKLAPGALEAAQARKADMQRVCDGVAGEAKAAILNYISDSEEYFNSFEGWPDRVEKSARQQCMDDTQRFNQCRALGRASEAEFLRKHALLAEYQPGFDVKTVAQTVGHNARMACMLRRTGDKNK